MAKITPCLWFDGDAEEAANFYVTLLPDSRVDNGARSPADNPSTPQGAVLAVDFTLAGQQFQGLNGGPEFPFEDRRRRDAPGVRRRSSRLSYRVKP